MVRFTITWLASFVTLPLPTGPTSVALEPSSFITSSARRKSASAPPTMMAREPFTAPSSPPLTGASRKEAPASASRS